MSASAFRERMAALKQRMSDFVSGRPRYTPLDLDDSLSLPLRSSRFGDDEGIETQGSGARGAVHSFGSEPGWRPERNEGDQRFVEMVPSMEEDLREVVSLATDASTFLWELLAGSGGSPDGDLNQSVANELLAQCHLFEKQLRGMIADYTGENEKLLADALEANDTLLNVLKEFQEVGGTRGGTRNGEDRTENNQIQNNRSSFASRGSNPSRNPFAPQATASGGIQGTSETSAGHKRQDSDPLIDL